MGNVTVKPIIIILIFDTSFVKIFVLKSIKLLIIVFIRFQLFSELILKKVL